MQKQQNYESSLEDEHPQIAVPYIPPPPPDNSTPKKFRSPLVNGVLVALAILLGGFMLYNFAGHELTQTAAVTSTNTSVTPTVFPSVSPTISPSPTPQY